MKTKQAVCGELLFCIFHCMCMYYIAAVFKIPTHIITFFELLFLYILLLFSNTFLTVVPVPL